LGKTNNVLGKEELWARVTTGWVFILLGVYLSLIHILEIFAVQKFAFMDEKSP